MSLSPLAMFLPNSGFHPPCSLRHNFDIRSFLCRLVPCTFDHRPLGPFSLPDSSSDAPASFFHRRLPSRNSCDQYLAVSIPAECYLQDIRENSHGLSMHSTTFLDAIRIISSPEVSPSPALAVTDRITSISIPSSVFVESHLQDIRETSHGLLIGSTTSCG